MEQLIAANVLVGDRNYRIKIRPEDEERVRHTTKIINEKIIEFKTHFAGKDMQDYIAMVLIWLATEKNADGSAAPEEENFAEKLAAIEKMLDGQLK